MVLPVGSAHVTDSESGPQSPTVRIEEAERHERRLLHCLFLRVTLWSLCGERISHIPMRETTCPSPMGPSPTMARMIHFTAGVWPLWTSLKATCPSLNCSHGEEGKWVGAP
jgi:hypothetical protein